MYGPKPTTWTFVLDDRTTRMSLVEIDETKDPIFATPNSISTFLGQFAESKLTPTEVSALLDISNRLFITSVIHYEFAAISVEKALQALELAVRMNLKTGKNVSFDNLIRKLEKEGALSQREIEFLDFGRNLRNSFAHPSNVNAFPMVMVAGLLRTTHELIARLFRELVTGAN